MSGSSQEPNASTRCGIDRAGDQRGVADDVRLVVGRGPGHENLRLRHQQRVGAVALGLERHDLVVEARLCATAARSLRADQHDRGDHGEQQHAKRQRAIGDDVVAD